MTEPDLSMLLVEILNTLWGVIQMWIGITTAMVASVHFAASRLNAFLVIGMISLYLIFNVVLALQGVQFSQHLQAIAQDLSALQDSGMVLSHSSLLIIQDIDRGLLRQAMPFVIWFVTFTSCV